MTAHWREDMQVFDLETTGLDFATARVVTATTARVGRRGADVTTWLINPGVEIPQKATDIHGITTEYAREHGRQPAEALAEIVASLRNAWAEGRPVVAYNASYDLTLLDRELRRYGMPGLEPEECRPVVDPLVIDRAEGPRRTGKRTLQLVCKYWKVPLDGAHDATEDALAAGRLAWRLAAEIPALQDVEVGELHDMQARWVPQNARGLASWMRRKAEKETGQEREELLARADGIDVDEPWPIRPYVADVAPPEEVA